MSQFDNLFGEPAREEPKDAPCPVCRAPVSETVDVWGELMCLACWRAWREEPAFQAPPLDVSLPHERRPGFMGITFLMSDDEATKRRTELTARWAQAKRGRR